MTLDQRLDNIDRKLHGVDQSLDVVVDTLMKLFLGANKAQSEAAALLLHIDSHLHPPEGNGKV